MNFIEAASNTEYVKGIIDGRIAILTMNRCNQKRRMRKTV